MNTTNQVNITVEATVNAPVETVWNAWTSPEHIVKWNCASEDWHTPKAENDIRTGGKFMSRMEAKDGSFGFDFEGIYDEIKVNEIIAYTLGDNRKVRITFNGNGNSTAISETFEAESTNPIEMQKGGWQAILDNFKKYTESLSD
ncbi:SRPBCC family protein [Pedobacter steynii]|uniref:Polyketide cyclase n=1 Tax=Pedobacter steynii TaxID=430522 RepID=A0A1D7QDF1_9SPHI|nr:SRPBCC family protein [Pedobacter steynii]AOM76728.1 polyketide cyclase [Pedobacter steynii]